MYTITATAPTAYQLNAVLYFGLGYKKNKDGSVTGQREFETHEEAKKHLLNILSEKYEGGVNDDEILVSMKEIENLSQLSYDGVTAYIEPINEMEIDGEIIFETK